MRLLCLDRVALADAAVSAPIPVSAGLVEIPFQQIASITRVSLGVRRAHEPNNMAVACFNLLGQQSLFDDSKTVLSAVAWETLHWALLEAGAAFFFEAIDRQSCAPVFYPAALVEAVVPDLPLGSVLHFSDGRASKPVQESSQTLCTRIAHALEHMTDVAPTHRAFLRASIFKTAGGMPVVWQRTVAASDERHAALKAWEQLREIPLPPPPAEEPVDLLAWEKRRRPIKRPAITKPALRVVAGARHPSR